MAKKRKSILFGILTLLLCGCVTAGASSLVYANADTAPSEEEPARTPAVTYVLGDASVTNEEGVAYDEASKTYSYREHEAGWLAAIAKSAELFDEESADANFVETKLASTWETTAFIQYNNAKYNVLLDLNGYDIDRGLTEAVQAGRVFQVQNGVLEITDTSADGNGKITGGYLSADNGAGITVNGVTAKVIFSGGSIEGNVGANGAGVRVNRGSFVMNGGFIKNNTATSNAHGVYVNSADSEFIMNGGSICDNGQEPKNGAAFYVGGGKLTINGGSIKNNSGASGGAIHAAGSSIVNINGGEISHNTASASGGAIYVNSSTVNISGGEISHNTAKDGGGVYLNVPGGGMVNVSGGEISYNVATNNGGGIGGSANVTGGKIIGNQAGNSGGGIYLVNSDALSLANCEISGNNANIGGGFHCQSGNAVVTLSGAVVLKDNTKGATRNDDGTFTGGTVENTTIRQNQKLLIAGKLCGDEGNKAEFHFNCSLNNAITQGYEENNLDEYGVPVDPAEYLKSDNAAQYVIMNADGELCMSKSVFEWSVICSEDAINEQTAYGASVTYSLNTVTAVTLTQDGNEVADLTYISAEGEEIAAPFVNAGTYYVVATVNGLGNNQVNTKYAIVVAPYGIADEESGAASGVSVTTAVPVGWTKESDANYTSVYNGSSKPMPTATVTVNGTSLVADTDFEVVGMIGGVICEALNNVGQYTMVVRGRGNFKGEVVLTCTLTIQPDLTKNYTTNWQYYNGTEWIDLADAGLTYSTGDYTMYVRAKLVQPDTNEIRYVYTRETEAYNLAADENEEDVTRALSVGIAKDGETALVNAGTYSLTIDGTPNYRVADEDVARALSIAPYSLVGKAENITASFNLSSTVYNGQEKEIKDFVASIELGSTVTFGSKGAEYNPVFKYVGEDGETVVDKIILGGEYKLYLEATGNNFAGVSGAIASFTITKANNTIGFSVIGNWMYGRFDQRVHAFDAHSTYLHDGTNAPAHSLMYTVLNADKEAISAVLTKFVEYTDDVAAALNALNAGEYYIRTEVDETESYVGVSRDAAFLVAKAFNGWTQNPDVVRWIEGKFNTEENLFVGTAAYGEADYVITDVKGKVLYDAAQGIDKRADMKAGTYLLTATVAGTDNYDGLTGSFAIRILEKVGLPWWATLCIAVGALLLAALIIFILWKKGVFRILTDKIIIAMRTKMTVDATIAAVRAHKRAEEAKKSVAKAEALDRLEAARQARLDARNKSPEERAAQLEAKAAEHAAIAEKNQKRANRLQKRANRLSKQTKAAAEEISEEPEIPEETEVPEMPEAPIAEQPESEVATTEAPTDNADEE